MKKNKIAFQGELGAYSHIASNSLFKDAEIKTCSTFEETFKTAFEDDSYKIVTYNAFYILYVIVNNQYIEKILKI